MVGNSAMKRCSATVAEVRVLAPWLIFSQVLHLVLFAVPAGLLIAERQVLRDLWRRTSNE